MASCRFCGSALRHTFVDLGMSPLCESYVTRDLLNHMEPFYPLHVYVCGECFLVQLEAYVSAEHIFSDYAFFSSYSDSWVEHARAYTEKMVERFHLRPQHHGIEPAANVAAVAVAKGIATVVQFLSEKTARELAAEGRQADLMAGNNVLAQVP